MKVVTVIIAHCPKPRRQHANRRPMSAKMSPTSPRGTLPTPTTSRRMGSQGAAHPATTLPTTAMAMSAAATASVPRRRRCRIEPRRSADSRDAFLEPRSLARNPHGDARPGDALRQQLGEISFSLAKIDMAARGPVNPPSSISCTAASKLLEATAGASPTPPSAAWERHRPTGGADSQAARFGLTTVTAWSNTGHRRLGPAAAWHLTCS